MLFLLHSKRLDRRRPHTYFMFRSLRRGPSLISISFDRSAFTLKHNYRKNGSDYIIRFNDLSRIISFFCRVIFI